MLQVQYRQKRTVQVLPRSEQVQVQVPERAQVLLRALPREQALERVRALPREQARRFEWVQRPVAP